MASLKTDMHHRPLGQLDSKHHLIESDRVVGTSVMNREGVKIGTIERLMIDKLSGQVEYAVLSAGGFLGVGETLHPVPWQALNYNREEGSYILDANRDRLASAPQYRATEEPDWSDQAYGMRLRSHYPSGRGL